MLSAGGNIDWTRCIEVAYVDRVKITKYHQKFPKKQDVSDSCASRVLVKLQEVKSWITTMNHSFSAQTAGADYIHIPPIKHFSCSLG